jgi:hypothetical protein
MRILTRFACAVVLFTLHACGSTPTAPSPAITGTWQGTYSLPSENPGTFSLELTQTGLSITGTALITQNQFADVPATWTATLATAGASTTMQFVMSYSFGDPPCPGQFKGTLNVSTHVIDGPFTGENCTRTFGGTLHAERAQ